MIASPMLAAAFTVVFAVTGLYSLVRIAGMASGAVPDGDRVAELSHLLMSIAMIAMTGAWSGGPDSASGILQIVVFGLIGLWFLVKVAGPDDGHRRVENGYHMVMAAAMVWMVAAMPVLMGGAGMSPGTSADAGEHAGHGSMAGMTGMAGMAGMAGCRCDGPGFRSRPAGVGGDGERRVGRGPYRRRGDVGGTPVRSNSRRRRAQRTWGERGAGGRGRARRSRGPRRPAWPRADARTPVRCLLPPPDVPRNGRNAPRDALSPPAPPCPHPSGDDHVGHP